MLGRLHQVRCCIDVKSIHVRWANGGSLRHNPKVGCCMDTRYNNKSKGQLGIYHITPHHRVKWAWSKGYT